MKAARYSKYGGAEVIETEEIDNPIISPGQVLVENYAASINPFDYKVRNGLIPGLPEHFPVTIGGDFAGKIIEVGSKVSEYNVGDEVYGQASVFGGATGSMAEYLVANLRSISKKPSNLDFVESASLPLVGASAIQAIEDHIGLKQGQRILIQGGSGGIGSIAIQIAKHIGAYVVTTASTENIDFVNDLGADLVIDYKKDNFSEKLKDLVAVLDATGQVAGEDSFKVLKRGGVFVSMTSKVNKDAAEKYDITVISQNSQTTSDRLERLRNYVEKEIVKPQVGRVFTLDRVVEAFKFQETTHTPGKVVVKIK